TTEIFRFNSREYNENENVFNTKTYNTNAGNENEKNRGGTPVNLVPPNDSASLREKIKEFLDSPAKLEKIAQESRKIVETYFTAKISADKLLRHYKELLDG
ncbi:MAG: glycosyltransferase, partial [Thermoguttaceae bacterium]